VPVTGERVDRALALKKQLVRRMGLFAIAYVRPKIPSKTLRRGLLFFPTSEVLGYVYLPHYWALYVHDGRGPFRMPAGSVMCWFRDPSNDPRLRGFGGQTPPRKIQLPRLTKSQFEFWLEENRRAIERGDQPPMIVTKQINKPTKATPFFSNEPGGGMFGFSQRVFPVLHSIVRADFKDQLRDLMDITDSAEASI
jgi:hypothetical protein